MLEFTVHGEGYEGPDPHTHDDHTDSFYVVEGELELTLGGGGSREPPGSGGTGSAGAGAGRRETFRGGPGTFVAAPPGVRHGFKVPPQAGPVRFLNVHAPGGFEHDLRRLNS